MRIALAVTLICAASAATALNLGKVKDAGKTVAASDTGKAVGNAAGASAHEAAMKVAVDKMNKKLENVQSENGPILFVTGKAVIDPACDKTMQAIADIMSEFTGTHVQVNGHTDNVGKKAANLKLSQARADAVVAYLVKNKGVDGKRLSAKGFGDEKPIGDNKTPAGRAKNRRVDFTVTSM
jgi:outer membrane protein OmpA-like peptidoglycan-associated protein